MMPQEYIKYLQVSLKAGINVISIKVIDTGGGGGLWGMDDQVYLEAGGTKINLAGDWLYKVGLNLPAPKDHQVQTVFLPCCTMR